MQLVAIKKASATDSTGVMWSHQHDIRVFHGVCRLSCCRTSSETRRVTTF